MTLSNDPRVQTTEQLRSAAIDQALATLAATAITAPKSGGQLFIRGAPSSGPKRGGRHGDRG